MILSDDSGSVLRILAVFFFLLGLYNKVPADCLPLELRSAYCVSVNVENAFHETEA